MNPNNKNNLIDELQMFLEQFYTEFPLLKKIKLYTLQWKDFNYKIYMIYVYTMMTYEHNEKYIYKMEYNKLSKFVKYYVPIW